MDGEQWLDGKTDEWLEQLFRPSKGPKTMIIHFADDGITLGYTLRKGKITVSDYGAGDLEEREPTEEDMARFDQWYDEACKEGEYPDGG